MNERMSPSTLRLLRTLGEQISIARRRRRLTQAELATRMGVSVGTVQRLEAGDPGVAMGSLAMALLAFGQPNRLLDVFPESQDDIGQMLDRERLPRRVRNARRGRPDEPTQQPVEADTIDGALF